MRRFVDFHTHSNASDGAMGPAEVVREADRLGLSAVALTDHDTTAGLADARSAARELAQLEFVPGVELSARYAPGVMHILGYQIDETSSELDAFLGRFRENRRQRNPQILAKLQQAGVDVTMDDVMEVARSRGSTGPEPVIGRLHIAEAIRRKGYVKLAQEAYTRYIGKGCVGFVDKEYRSPREVIEAIHAAGGLACLAHPYQLKCRNRQELKTVVKDLVDVGLDGIEVYHSGHSAVQVRLYLDLARAMGLGVVGGSDFHGSTKPHVTMGVPKVPIEAIEGEFARRLMPGRGDPA